MLINLCQNRRYCSALLLDHSTGLQPHSAGSATQQCIQNGEFITADTTRLVMASPLRDDRIELRNQLQRGSTERKSKQRSRCGSAHMAAEVWQFGTDLYAGRHGSDRLLSGLVDGHLDMDKLQGGNTRKGAVRYLVHSRIRDALSPYHLPCLHIGHVHVAQGARLEMIYYEWVSGFKVGLNRLLRESTRC